MLSRYTDRSGPRQLFHNGARSSVNLSLSSNVEPDDPDRSEVELRLKRKWSDGSESLIFSQRDFVERLAGVIPPPWFNFTRFHGVFAPNHAWLHFVVPVLQRSERAQPLMNRTILIHHQPANRQLVGHLANIGYRGLSFFAKQWESITKYVYAAQE
jgi:hypothetical protein